MEKTSEEQFPHEEFIASNNINVDELHAKLKESIDHFEILEKIYQDWDPPEEDELTTRETFHRELTIKSIQILDTLIEEFADKLENNEEQDDQEEKAKAVKPAPQKEPGQPSIKKPEQEPSPKGKTQPEPPKAKTDEEIIQALWDKGVRSGLPRVYKSAGLRTTLQGRKIKVGKKFTLVKGAFTLKYHITLNPNY